MTDIQARVQQRADKFIESGAERGIQVAVYRGGEQIVDVVAGTADPVTGRPVTPATVFHNFSIGKGITASVAHVLVERGLFGYDTPVAELWPEFAAHGKSAVTVRHVLSHTAGVPGLPPDFTPEDMCDWDTTCQLIADEQPWWPPGAKTGYHAFTFGFIVGEIVRRTTGKPISQIMLEHIAEPLGVATELYYGMPETEQHRLARLQDAPGALEAMASMPDDLPMLKAMPRALLATAQLGSRPDFLAADIPAISSISARAIARMYAALLGEVDGVRLIPPDRLRAATAVAASGEDVVMGVPSTWALGYSVGRLGTTAEQTPTVFGMAGAGGSYAYADKATGIAFALTKNTLTPDFDTATEVSQVVSDTIAQGLSP